MVLPHERHHRVPPHLRDIEEPTHQEIYERLNAMEKVLRRIEERI